MIKNIAKIALTSAILTIGAIVLLNVDSENLRDFVEKSGIFANLTFILSFAILPIFFFPVSILAIISGVFFGLFWGSIYTMVGAMINCALMYYLSNLLGKDVKFPKFITDLNKFDDRKLFIAFCVLRFLPIVPYNALNYAPIVCRINFKSYILSSFLGFIPWTPIFVNIGVNSGDKNGLIISVLIAVFAILLSIIATKWIQKNYIKDKI
ncbi:TVP38/TMEM64 family protein [Campylobacter corcagiensis]|uniref:TVP38/TMEM64 family membrane protein n=1 Tax=Campylobacter corcagiensis TaxID=1448857 RepID=A0A7M1LET8_9BACT|nr:VTT domain-containing protein [Campylobacter corcagiensis]QKF64744.1 YdjX family membrane protein (SNARE domain) [Campylobacter corcagiensis]QOQ87092.1 TVP38/TMEM64 family protein [Campylobacter corcagiensis]